MSKTKKKIRKIRVVHAPPKKSDIEIIRDLTSDDSGRDRRVVCDVCGAKDHVRKFGKKHLCPNCR